MLTLIQCKCISPLVLIYNLEFAVRDWKREEDNYVSGLKKYDNQEEHERLGMEKILRIRQMRRII